jgi:hypothetical protein
MKAVLMKAVLTGRGLGSKLSQVRGAAGVAAPQPPTVIHEFDDLCISAGGGDTTASGLASEQCEGFRNSAGDKQ